MKKFVILDHHPPQSQHDSATRTEQRHFDLMFEVAGNDKLLTFAITELPGQGESIDVTMLTDHRAEYLGYEGPVSNNRGDVERFAFGQWSGKIADEVSLVFDADAKNFAGQRWKIKFHSKQLFRIA